MSLNIKTSSGLKKLTPEINESTVIAAIGYPPAKKEVVNTHIDDPNVHVTAEEKATWNAKSDFNGDYNSLKNTPTIPELPEWTQDIQDDGQGTYAIVDEQGRKALEISADGITNLAKLQIKGEDLETIIDNKIPEEVDPTVEDWAKKENATLIPNDKLSIANWAKAETKPSYSVSEVSNAVPSSRKINGKELSSDISLALSDLNEAPNIVETDDGSFVIADENGTKAFEITLDGTTSVAALTVDGKTLESIIDDRIPEPDYSIIIPDNETDPTVSSWAKTNNTDTIPESKLPTETDPTVASWAKNDSTELIPNDKLSIADWAKEPQRPSYSVSDVSGAVPNSRTINGKDLSADISLMLSDLTEAPDIVETDDGYFTIVDEDRNKVLEIDNLGNINVASLNVVDSNKNEIFKVSVESGITKVKALEVNQKSLEDIIDEKIAAIPEVEIPEVKMPTDTISKITHFEMWGGEVSLEPKPDGIIYNDEGYFSLEDGNDYDFTISKRIPLAQGNNITFTPVENDPSTLQINAEVPTKLSELDTDDNNQRVSVADKEKWNAVTNKASTTALQSHIDNTNNPHNVTAEQVGLGDVSVDENGSFVLVDTNSNKAFEVTSNGTVAVAKLSVGGTDINEQLNTLASQFDDYQPKGIYVTTDTTQTISGSKTYTGQQTFSNGKFAVKANSANDDSWINLTNNTNGAYYAFGIRRPYTSYGLQMKYHPDASNQDTSRPGEATGTADLYFDIYHSGNYTKIPVATGTAAGLMSAAHKTAVDGLANTYLAKSGGVMAGAITMNGNNISGAGTITAATFQASSDARLKENLQPLQPHASILSLPTYEFDFIDGPKDQIGCLAQDLAHIHPKLVTVNENGYLTINETKLVYLLLEEMKKLQSKIVDLESQLNLLK